MQAWSLRVAVVIMCLAHTACFSPAVRLPTRPTRPHHALSFVVRRPHSCRPALHRGIQGITASGGSIEPDFSELRRRTGESVEQYLVKKIEGRWEPAPQDQSDWMKGMDIASDGTFRTKWNGHSHDIVDGQVLLRRADGLINLKRTIKDANDHLFRVSADFNVLQGFCPQSGASFTLKRADDNVQRNQASAGKFVVVWHAVDHAEGQVFNDLEEARTAFEVRDRGPLAAVLYDDKMRVLQKWGFMQTAQWKELEDWSRNALLGEMFGGMIFGGLFGAIAAALMFNDPEAETEA